MKLLATLAGLSLWALTFSAQGGIAGARLELLDGRSGKVVWSTPLHTGQTVVLGYMHSLYGVPQREIYQVGSDGLRLHEMVFGSYDAAAYYNPDPTPPAWFEDGVWHLRGMTAMPPAPFRVGYETGHFIEVGTTRTPVAPHVPSGELALLRVVRAGTAGSADMETAAKDQR